MGLKKSDLGHDQASLLDDLWFAIRQSSLWPWFLLSFLPCSILNLSANKNAKNTYFLNQTRPVKATVYFEAARDLNLFFFFTEKVLKAEHCQT